LALGVALDAVFGDPRRGHPVAVFGRGAARLEDRLYGDSRVRGIAFTAGCVGAAIATGVVAERAARGPVGRTLVTAAATWAVLGGTSLGREGTAMAALLERGDLPGARGRLPHLCGRDPSGLGEKELARATVESIAENTSDAAVAPLLWGAVAGVPGLLGYRAINTLDAMVGHRDARYRDFGWASARLDDLANWLPARLTGLLTVATAPLTIRPGDAAPDRGEPRPSRGAHAAAPRSEAARPYSARHARLGGGSAVAAWRALRRDGGRHPSPNAGRCEAAFAGALEIRLGGTNAYHGRVEARPTLGDGRPPETADIRRAVRLSTAVTLAAAAVACAIAGARR
jgi:adenosylcobinamide-phosphate synthase